MAWIKFGALVPKASPEEFAVIACDQYTSEPQYWHDIKSQVGEQSALDLILPECFLRTEKDAANRIATNTKRFLKEGRFTEVNAPILVKRKTAFGRERSGIVAAVNLNDYDYAIGNSALIRASERTVKDRLTARTELRKRSSLDLPHVILLIDDRENIVKKAVDEAQQTLLYSGRLSGNGGFIEGYSVNADLTEAFERVRSLTTARYGTPLAALVGDGNHSFAAAKLCYESAPNAFDSFALCEIINIYDEGLVFEPIHRTVKTSKGDAFLKAFAKAVKGDGSVVIHNDGKTTVLPAPLNPVEAVKAVDAFIESECESCDIDYVHTLSALDKKDCVGIELKGIKKSELFEEVVRNGVLPKKCFSLGETDEKRYYMEARKIAAD